MRMVKKKILTQRKKPTHRKQPWFFYAGLAVLILGVGLTVGWISELSKPRPVAVKQTQMLQQEMKVAPTLTAKGRGTPLPPPAETVTPDEVQSWLDVVTEFLGDLAGLFMTAGGAVMLWLNIKEKRKDLAEKEKG